MTRLAELRALYELAQYWTVAYHNGVPKLVYAGDFDDVPRRNACDFVVRMRDALPALLDVAEGLATQRPPIYDGMYCMLCHKHTDDESNDWEMKPENHVASCPWLLARAMITDGTMRSDK